MAITLLLEGAPDLVIGEITPAGVAAISGSSLNVLSHPDYYVTGTEMRAYCQANGVGDPTYNCGSSKVQVHWESYTPYIKLIQPNGTEAYTFRGNTQRSRDYPLIGGDVDNPTAAALDQQSGTPTSFSWFVGADKSAATITKIKAFFDGAKIKSDFPGEPSTTGGGIGNFDLSSDPIDFPAIPSTGAVNSKFVSLYNPTETELNQIQSYLWTTDMGQAWEAIFKFIQDPMDMVIGLNMFPFTIPSTKLSPNKEPVEAGIIDIMADPLTKVTSYKLLSQYIELDCGSIDVGQFYGTALDFQPYTKATIHVPFCGDYPLNIDDIRSNLDASVSGKTLHLKYHVDMFSGACVAMLKVGDAVLYQWSGSMAMNVPLTGSDYSNTIQNVISTATTIGMAASGAGAAAGAAKGAAGTSKAAAKEASAAAAKDSAIADLMSASTTMASSLKPQIQRAGSVAGSAGFLGVQSPYIVFEIPRQSIAEDYSTFMGFPCNVSYTLSSLVGKGFTVVSNMHLENITTNTAAIKSGATDNELGEIEKLLSGGVIL